MALCDYRLCDRCGGKAFYDAHLNYGDPGETSVHGRDYTLDHVGDWAVLCQTCAETHAVVIVSHETGAPRLEDGWRRCAVGQRTTQHCGIAEEARAQERARIRARVRAMIADWMHESSREGQSLMFYDDCAGRIRGLWQVLNMVEEDASHADTDKTPAECATVQGKDSPCAVRERARILAAIDALMVAYYEGFSRGQGAYDEGALDALMQARDIIDRKDASHE